MTFLPFADLPEDIVDLSHSISSETPVFPGDGPVEIHVMDSTERSRRNERHLNCSRLGMSVHTGTHMDAPFHFFGEGTTIDRILVQACIGPAALIRIPPAITEIDAGVLTPYAERIRRLGRVILNTGWHHRWGTIEYFRNHPVLSKDAARWLADLRVRLVGVDTPSVDRDPYPAHLELLGAGILIVENLTNLDAITADTFYFLALPLKIKGRDGSPVRAVGWMESELRK